MTTTRTPLPVSGLAETPRASVKPAAKKRATKGPGPKKAVGNAAKSTPAKSLQKNLRRQNPRLH